MKKTIFLIIAWFAFHPVFGSNFYWVNGPGTWDDYANHWATTSGGSTFHTNPPQPGDDVFFDANSFSSANQRIRFLNSNVFCRDFNYSCTLAGISLWDSLPDPRINVFGSVEIAPNTDLSIDAILCMKSGTTTNTINIQDSISGRFEFNNAQGVWTLLSPFISRIRHTSSAEIELLAGTLNTNNFPVLLRNFTSDNGSPSRTFNAGNSKIYFCGYYESSQGSPSASMEIDSLLNFDGSQNDFTFLTPADPDTFGMALPFFECRVRLLCPGSNVKSISWLAPKGGFGSFKMFNMINVIGTDFNIENVNLSNTTFNYVGDNFIADSIVGSSSLPDFPDLSQVAIISTNYQSINYIAAPSIWFEPSRDSYSPTLIATGDIYLHAYCNGSVNSNNYFHTVQAGTNVTLEKAIGTLQITKCSIGLNGIFNSSCSFDTLMFSAGGNYTIKENDTLTVNNEFIAFGNAVSPIQINSKTSGIQSKMIFNQNSVCSDYLYLQDIVATGTSVSAGSNSINLANSSGWAFSPCSNSSNVWPGDANYDLVVNNFDLLNLGIAYGDTGIARQNATINYSAQPAADWNTFFITAVNKKHADCDGNGIVNSADTSAISANYGLIHPAKNPFPLLTTNAGVPLFFQLPGGILTPGSNVSIPVILGDVSYPVNSIYGIAFSINYDPALIVPGSVNISYAGSWMATPGNYLNLEKDFSSGGYIDMAFTRITRTDTSGKGMIAILNFTVAASANDTLKLTFSQVAGVDHNGNTVAVSTQNGSVVTNINQTDFIQQSLLFPDPVRDKAIIQFSNPFNEKLFLYIFASDGRKLFSLPCTEKNIVTFERKNLANGIYFFELRNGKGSKIHYGKFAVN